MNRDRKKSSENKNSRLRGTAARRKAVLFLVLLLCVCTLGLPAQAASRKSRAIRAYKKFLSQKTIRWCYYTDKELKKHHGNMSAIWAKAKKNKFALIYLDRDSVPEMMLMLQEGGGIQAGEFQLYKYQSGKVRKVEEWGGDNAYNWPKIYYYNRKNILLETQVYGVYDGYRHPVKDFWYSKYTGSRVVSLFLHKTTQSGRSLYEYKNKKVSKSKFNSLLKKQIGSRKPTKVVFHKNTAANRKKYLK